MINFLKTNQRLSIALTTAVTLAGALSLTSCQDEDNGMTAEEIKFDIAAKKYAENFKNYFGEPDPNHTWGFGAINAASITRAMTRDGQSTGTINVNRNQWAQKSGDGFIAEAVVDDVTIPGWPNDDNYYYYDKGEDKASYTPSQTWPADNNCRPIGDVTPYEIQYVSNWFRTHEITNPEDYREHLHLSDFFIQNVCADADQWSYDTSIKPTGANGTNITNVTQELLDQYNIENITLRAATQSPQYNLDHLCFKPMGANSTVDGTWTHVNDFNAGNSNHDPENHNASYNINRKIQYITSSGTEDFACRASLGTQGGQDASAEYLYDWVLVKLEWTEPEMPSGAKNVKRVGYYLAFDFAASKNEIDIEGDNFYSNWIIKISPADFSTIEPDNSRRVMCEDLGNTFDFDFNDVVFDVRYETTNGNLEAIISLQAAGGTLPIYVGDTKYESHYMLYGTEMDPKQPINVDNSNTRGVSIYRIPATTKDPDDIVIYVDYSENDRRTVAKANRGNLINQDGGYNPGPYFPQHPLTGTTAPQKFAVPITVQWMKELQFIEQGYPQFKYWVQDIRFANWYNKIGNTNLIYNYVRLNEHSAFVTGVDDNVNSVLAAGVTIGSSFVSIDKTCFLTATSKIEIAFDIEADKEVNIAYNNYSVRTKLTSSNNTIVIEDNTQIANMQKNGFTIYLNYCTDTVTKDKIHINCI